MAETVRLDESNLSYTASLFRLPLPSPLLVLRVSSTVKVIAPFIVDDRAFPLSFQLNLS